MPFYKPFSENPMVTKQDYQQLVLDLFEPVRPYLASQGAKMDFDQGGAIFDMSASALEGVARLLWGIIPLVKGGGEFEHWDLFHAAISQGTDPNHPNYWGVMDTINQTSVEKAAFGLLLAVLPEHGWAPLDPQTKENFAQWLAQIQQAQMPQNNWLFFTILVQAGLRKVGRSDLVDINKEASYLKTLKSFYLGDGWYGDGAGKNIDHYGGFAIHYYSLIYASLIEDADNELKHLFIERANEFCEPFSYWFAESGECMAQGRSLTYRFATAGFWASAAISDLSAMELGTIKGLWARHLRQWKDKPIFTAEGLLTRGYDYPTLTVCEGYNSPTSPYWAFKAFLPLALEDSHPFWQVEEKPLALSKKVYAMPAANTIIQRVGGHSIAHFSGTIEQQFQVDKYNKFAYSTCFGADFDSLKDSHQLLFGDNILAISFDEGVNWQMRMNNHHVVVDETQNRMSIEWTTGTLNITTVIDVLDNGESIRTHTIELPQDAWIVESGFAVSNWYQPKETLIQRQGIQANIEIRGANGTSQIISLDGYEKESRDGYRIHTNVVSPRTHVPYLLTKLSAGKHQLISRYRVHPTT
ncbi:hypothetical protein ST37_18680 [Vibrio sp. qd031]|uniref:DUF2264 domain-containing protein n=1 Tax=Vibrio sp. qd031 TaxID=1603038 RepID=UPI000A103F26|nr:DUF2264 domain-containing protein [Vibrio sp. qd031]ORT48246.1 hypothetical protein ST37_18680 [Vibrio sp. qd031]